MVRAPGLDNRQSCPSPHDDPSIPQSTTTTTSKNKRRLFCANHWKKHLYPISSDAQAALLTNYCASWLKCAAGSLNVLSNEPCTSVHCPTQPQDGVSLTCSQPCLRATSASSTYSILNASDPSAIITTYTSIKGGGETLAHTYVLLTTAES